MGTLTYSWEKLKLVVMYTFVFEVLSVSDC